MKKDSKIYVAGHTGLVGSEIVRRLEAGGYSKVITRTFEKLDLRNQASCESFFEKEKPEYVFLAAAKVGGILANSTYKAEFIYDNLMISANVIHASHKFGVKKLINLGSSCIYPRAASQPLKEDSLLSDTLEPTNEPYAIAKISAIKLCRYYNEQYGTNFISVMPTNMYGPDDNFNLETSHVLPALTRKLYLAKLLTQEDFVGIKNDLLCRPVGYKIGESQIRGAGSAALVLLLDRLGIKNSVITLWGTGNVFREFMHVSDLSSALILLMDKYGAKEIGEAINIGTGIDMKIKDLSKLVGKIVGYDGRIEFEKSEMDGTPRKLLDVSKIKKLGWEFRVDLESGIRMEYEKYLCKLNGFELLGPDKKDFVSVGLGDL
jgi:GDP-L-fucose synthase